MPPLYAAVVRQRYAFGQASDGGSEGMARPAPLINFAELDAQNYQKLGQSEQRRDQRSFPP
ncbi:hypothetical protein EAS62_39360 [Bradyrhizobium zhanjiangense]|uniref:Uncharacterized protein n=1 Tax=Bradyrhizobium zhanjiangense TaxID=1325107 RepID=A0ABY0D8N7_9BRAD|nr:hypothetical protein EAS62_39360 [Bradyrhizobium zhanjiangense]